MPIRMIYLRTRAYLRSQGLKSSLRRMGEEVKNRLLHDRLVLYWLDLTRGDFEGFGKPENCRVVRYDQRAEMPESLLERMVGQYTQSCNRTISGNDSRGERTYGV